MSRNALADETSPYLLQHRHNPVHWQPWGREALARAKAEDRPILLSVGYAACHWCHVMAHESFEDPAIAALMNEHFVNIKVDREERPDLDAIYQSALALLGEHGGWPLTMFLTPAAEPFWGGTYFPPTPRYGRPGFADVLRGVAQAYRGQADRVRHTVAAMRQALDEISRLPGGDGLAPTTIHAAAEAAVRHVDMLHGGTIGAPKFPQPMFFRFLWAMRRRLGHPAFANAVTVTLDRMCQGGIYDHLGGGFARYSTDEAWLVPHFEKMLYDNALLVELLAEVWLETRNPLYAERARETVAWALRDMRVGSHGGDGAFAFAAAFDADSEGEEGKYYVWTEAEIDTLLGADAAAFKTAYDVTPGGNWEGRTILNRGHAPRLGDAAAEARLGDARARLLAARATRVPPLRDDKVLADWNGMMIAALARAGAALGEGDWIATAARVFDFVRATLTADGRLHHSWCRGRLGAVAVVDDLAEMARAALVLLEITGQARYLEAAEAWASDAERHHRDPAGGYFLSADDADDVITRTRTAIDNAVPSGNGVMADNLARLLLLTGKAEYGDRADALFRAFSGNDADRLVASPTLLDAFILHSGGTQIVIVGEDPAGGPLLRAALESAAPARVIQRVADGRALPAGHPAHGKTLVGGRPAAYVCVGATCGLPVTSAAALAAELARA